MAFIEALHARCAASYFHHTALKMSVPHEPSYPLFTADYIVFLEGFEDPWAAIGLVAFLMDSDDLLQKSPIGLHPLAHRSFFPRVVAASGDAEVPAEEGEAVFLMIPLNKGEGIRLLSIAKCIVFFKRSFSRRAFRKAFSKFRMRSWSDTLCSISVSLCKSGWGLPFRMPSRYSFLHRESMKGWISSALATSWIRVPGRSVSFTAVILNSLL